MPGLQAAIDTKLAELGTAVEANLTQGPDAAAQIMLSNLARNTMSVFRNRIDEVIGTENELLKQRLAGLAESRRQIAALDTTLGILALVVMGLGAGTVVLGSQRIAQFAGRHEQSEEHFLFLVHAVTDYAIYMLDPEGRASSWNAGAERIKGYGTDESLGQDFSRFFTEEDRKAEVPRHALERAARDGKYEAEAWRVRQDGSRFWANVVTDALYGPAR